MAVHQIFHTHFSKIKCRSIGGISVPLVEIGLTDQPPWLRQACKCAAAAAHTHPTALHHHFFQLKRLCSITNTVGSRNYWGAIILLVSSISLLVYYSILLLTETVYCLRLYGIKSKYVVNWVLLST